MSLRVKYLNSKLQFKTCYRCKKTYPRDEEHFYRIKHRTTKGSYKYSSYCIKCDRDRKKEWRKQDSKSGRKRERQRKYLSTERGYFKELWQSCKKSTHGCLFRNYEEFFECWEDQQKIYGTKCPYLGIEMTRIKGKKRATPTNISKDRILSSMPYGPKNIMFISWKANNMKGDVTPYLASRYLDFVNENEYSRKVTEFELETMDHKFGHRFNTDFDFIVDMVEHNRQSLELQSEFIDKFLKMIKTEPNQIPEDPEDTSHDN